MVTIKKGTEHTEEFQPKPDQSRLPPLVRHNKHIDRIDESWVKACKDQRDADAKFYQAHIEALIEEIHNWSHEKCTEHDGNTSMNSIRRKDCGKCWAELKAKYTSKGDEG